MKINGILSCIAPCGIYCIGCVNYSEHKTCRGCRLDSHHDRCDIFDCCVTMGGKVFCNECEYFPCERLKEFSQYGSGETSCNYRHVVIKNLERMRDVGIENWILDMNEKIRKGEYKVDSKECQQKNRPCEIPD